MRALCAANLLRQHAAPTYCVFWAGNLLAFRAIESNAIRGSSAAAAAVEGAARAAPGPAQEQPGARAWPAPLILAWRGGGGEAQALALPFCFILSVFRDEPTVR